LQPERVTNDASSKLSLAPSADGSLFDSKIDIRRHQK
jgi:hypothetical protein